MAIVEKALVRTAGNVLLRIEMVDSAALPGTKAGLAWMDVERVDGAVGVTAFTKPVVTAGVVGGKWRITTGSVDLVGQDLTDAKFSMVSDADLTLAEGERWLLNGLYAIAKIISPTMTQAQFLSALAAAQTDPGSGAQRPIGRAQMLGLLAGLL
jgi:hypothetical protein